MRDSDNERKILREKEKEREREMEWREKNCQNQIVCLYCRERL